MIATLKRARTAWGALSAANRWRIALGLIAVVLLVSLLIATKPWEVQTGPRPKLRHLIAIYTWYGKAFCLAAITFLAVVCPWWTRPIEKRNDPSGIPNPRWFWPLVIVAMAVTACLAVPRLGFSLWDDEELCTRHSLAGKFRTNENNGEVTFSPLKWEDTFFGYETPNNHVLFSIFSRLSGTVAGAINPPKELPFSELPLRFPALIFGMLGVASAAWFLKEMGWPGAGVIAAFLLALHPWHIRYASEARGYSLVLLIVPLVYVFWRKAIQDGRWRWWAAFAAAQFALLYTYPGMLFLLIVLNVLCLPAMALAADAAKPFLAQSGRWFFANSCAGLLVILLMLPLIPQARIYFDHEGSRQIVLGWSWVRSALSFMLAGVPWAGAASYAALGNLTTRHPLLLQGLVLSVLAFLGVGAFAFCRRSFLHTCIAVAIFATPMLTFQLSRARKILIYESYTIYALPGLVALVAVGIVLACRQIARLPAGRWLAPAAAAAFVLCYAAATWDFRGWIVSHPLQQIRESVMAYRPTLDPFAPRQASILSGSFCIPPYLYDPRMIRADSADEFIALMETADKTGKPLYINIGMPWAAREYSPRMWQMFNDDRLFGDRQEFLGFDAGLDRLVAKYKPGSAASYDFSALRGGER